MHIHGRCWSGGKEEADTAAETSPPRAELGRNEIKPGQRHRVLRAGRRKTLQCMCLSVHSSATFSCVFYDFTGFGIWQLQVCRLFAVGIAASCFVFRYFSVQAFNALTLLVGHPACKKNSQWWGAGMVICLERGADLHVAQLKPLPLTLFCFSKIQIGFTFLVLAHPGSPEKGH